jgi:alpha-tubulin suppressor-like RCC1 family protein
MPNQFLSPEGDLENYFVTEYWLIDQYIGDQLWTWGSGSVGQLGNAVTTGNISTPVTTFAGGTNWKQVESARGNQTSVHTAAIKTDGTLWTWGLGTFGRLGNAVTTNTSTPVTTFAGGTNWKQVNVGSTHTAAIKTDGTLWVWGSGYNSQLGINIALAKSTPVTTFAGGTNWKQVSCGDGHTAAIKTDGTLWLWGGGTSGRLGNATINPASTPVTTFAGGTNWKQVSCGDFHTAAIKTDGTLWIWGNGGSRLGNGTNDTINRSTPVTTFAGGTNWKQVSAAFIHTAAIKTDGTLWTWGAGNDGLLGNGVTTGSISTPVTTFAGGTNWKQVICGEDHNVAIKTDGTLWTWGDGLSGRLGNAAGTDRSTPVTTFAGGTDWKQVGLSGLHTVAVKSGINPEYPLS